MTAGADTGRVVVYGEYPPFPAPAAAATLATVRSLLSDGRDVEVVSPRPSAAHHHAEVGNPKGAAKLVRLAGGAELVARFDPGILGLASGAGPAAARAAVGLAVRRARTATVHLSPLTAQPAGKWVRWILGPAARVTVASREDAATLEAKGLDAAKLRVTEDRWWLAPGAAGGAADASGSVGASEAWAITAGASREEVEAEVRRRAARDRDNDDAFTRW